MAKPTPHLLQRLPHGKTPNGATYVELGLFGNSEMELIQLRAKQVLPAHYHVHTSSIFYFIRGKGKLLIGKKWHAYKPGDSFEIPRKTTHGFRTQSETVFIAHETPPIEHPKTGKVDMVYP